MRTVRLSVLLVSLVVVWGGNTASGASICRVFVLKQSDRGIEIVREDIDGHEPVTGTFAVGRQSGVIDVIFPVGPGGSGGLVRLDEGGTLTVRCQDGEMQVTTETENGKTWARPARTLGDLALYDVRVSVTAGDGGRRAFLIEQNERVSADDVGPVINMFAGRVPLADGDYVICTDTYRHSLGTPVTGRASLEIDRYPFVKGRLSDSREGSFIVDFGAGTTVVSKSFLPTDTPIEAAAMAQYSAAGKELLKYAPSGATGSVQNILGHATLSDFRMGGIRFDHVSVDVIEALPDFFGRPIDGIIGLDLLRRSHILSFSLGQRGSVPPQLSFGSVEANPEGSAVELPFSIVKSHIFVNGSVNDVPVSFILDTGAPNPLLDVPAAKAAKVNPDRGRTRKARGLDGKQTELRTGAVAMLTLGGTTFQDVAFDVSALPVFAMLRAGGQGVGLMGNSFFARCRRVDIDFERRVVRFVR
ncbi:MAG: aspartyl protease family protein [Phycisphaerae bacterium]|jgi:hypothetical protein